MIAVVTLSGFGAQRLPPQSVLFICGTIALVGAAIVRQLSRG
jgi:hypothetical protein